MHPGAGEGGWEKRRDGAAGWRRRRRARGMRGMQLGQMWGLRWAGWLGCGLAHRWHGPIPRSYPKQWHGPMPRRPAHHTRAWMGVTWDGCASTLHVREGIDLGCTAMLDGGWIRTDSTGEGGKIASQLSLAKLKCPPLGCNL